MIVTMVRLSVFVLTSLALISLVYGQDVCVKKGPCTCEFANGTGFDLTPAVTTTFYQAQTYVSKDKPKQFELQTYYFHPCFDVKYMNSTGNKNDTCDQALSICRHTYTMDLVVNTTDTFKEDTGAYNYLGSVNTTTFSSDGGTIIYGNAESSTQVTLVCAQTANQLHVVSADDPANIQLAFYSKEACLRQIEELGRSFGSTLCIIFFSLVIFYLSLGVLTRKFLMGATGLEVIPNLPFWLGLPDLVKDGWAFARNGFKLPARGSGPTISPDPNSYDSI